MEHNLDAVLLVLVTATLAVAVFCAMLLSIRSVKTQAYWPLALFFITLCVASGGPVVKALAPDYLQLLYAFTLPAYLAMGPLLYFYVRGLTAERLWRFDPKNLWQFIPFFFGLTLVLQNIFIFDMSVLKADAGAYLKDKNSFFRAYVVVNGLLWWGSQILLFSLPFIYAFLIIRHLSLYRKRLKGLFASNENRELGWVSGYLALFAFIWIFVLLTIIKENLMGPTFMTERMGATAFLLLVASLGLFSLNQKPGFEGRYLAGGLDDEMLADSHNNSSEKYKRSALGEEQARRIATKIERSMETDKLYLDASLSLHKLSKHIMVSPNHISQTLNETIGECFFDYVNKWRVSAAKPDILSGDKTVLAVAYDVGFNARSSFYKAFKRETGQTPSEFRKRGKA